MKNLFVVLSSAAVAVLLTLVTVVAGLLHLMFTTGEELTRKVGLFGSLFFETTAAPGGATGVSMGVADLGPLVVLAAVLLVVLVLGQLVYRGLRGHRQPLRTQHAGA